MPKAASKRVIFHEGSGNVFADLNLPEPEKLLAEANRRVLASRTKAIMNSTTKRDEKTGFGSIHFRTQTGDEEAWRYSIRPGPGQHIEFRDIDNLNFELALVNDADAGKPAPEPPKPQTPPDGHSITPPTPKPRPNFADMDEADLRTIAAERQIKVPAGTKRKGDLIKLLQDHDAK